MTSQVIFSIQEVFIECHMKQLNTIVYFTGYAWKLMQAWYAYISG